MAVKKQSGRSSGARSRGRKPAAKPRRTGAGRPAGRARSGRPSPPGILRLALLGILLIAVIGAAGWYGLSIFLSDSSGTASDGEGAVTLAVSRPAPRAITAVPRRSAADDSAGPISGEAAQPDAIGNLIQQLEKAGTKDPRHNPEAADPSAVAALPQARHSRAGQAKLPGPGEREFGEAGFPRIAIVIDDLGGNPDAIARLMALPGPVSYAFLTANGGSPEQAKAVARAGLDVMLHLPMEPEGPQNPGPNALLVANGPEENLRRLRWHLARLPLAVGVNNHMGSRFTADAAQLRPILAALRADGLFWLDSRTSGHSIGYSVAKELKMRAVQRDIFLDHDPDEDSILRQLQQAEAVAAREGHAIAIGHPYPETLATLERWMPQAQGRGFVLVGVTDLLPRGEEPLPQAVSGGAPEAMPPDRMSN